MVYDPEVRPYPVVSPNSTNEVANSSVVHVTVAVLYATPDDETEVMTGTVVSVVNETVVKLS
jgi:hypothetical protein